ncbi:hypothetical protein NU219Hw_g7740t1 [Hortaea werneckii]
MDDPSEQVPSSSSLPAADHPRIHLYAEHLQNIRTLSIQASLATFSNTETKATLSADGSQLSLSHEGETATIQLPITVPGGHNDATLTIPSAPSKELTFRVSLEEKPGSNLLGTRPTGSETIVPWMSSHLSAHAEISCAKCQTVLIPRGAVTQWKDLPSEGWAEMMDFWHCHKPDVPHDHHYAHGGDGSAGRGIGANSKLAVERGVGLVGPLELLFAKEDTRSIKRECDERLTYGFLSFPVFWLVKLFMSQTAPDDDALSFARKAGRDLLTTWTSTHRLHRTTTLHVSPRRLRVEEEAGLTGMCLQPSAAGGIR